MPHHLTAHEEGEKENGVLHCDKEFTHPPMLQRHRLTHADARQHRCHCGKAYQRRSRLVKHIYEQRLSAAVNNFPFDYSLHYPEYGNSHATGYEQQFSLSASFMHHMAAGPGPSNGYSMHSCQFDQSAYISFLVDEAVKGSETQNRPPTVPLQNPSSLAPPCRFTPPYPEGVNHPPYTGLFSSQTVSNGSYQTPLAPQAQGHTGFRPPSHQNFIIDNRAPVSGLQNVAPEFSPSFDACTNFIGQDSQINTNLPGYQTSSFCLDQHIGLNQPSVVNARQLNNKIQVQYHFPDNDRFSVQSTNQAQLNGPNLNCQTFNNNVHKSPVCTVDVNGNTGNFNSSISPKLTDVGDFSQFCVANIIGRNSAGLNNEVNGSKTLANRGDRVAERQAEEREYYNHFMLKEKQRVQSQNNCTKSSEKDKQKVRKNIQRRSIRNEDVSSQNEKSKKRENVCATVSGTNSARQVETVEKSSVLEERPDHHAVSREYYKEYVEFVKNKKKGVNAEDKDLKKGSRVKTVSPSSRSKSKVGDGNGVELLSLTYQCGDCMQTYDNIKELRKHIRINHTNKKKKSGKTVEQSQKAEDSNVTDLIESEEIEVNMAFENVENEIMETETQNEGSELPSYLCSYCGYESKTLAETSEHQKTHEDKVDSERADKNCHKEEREYLQLSKELGEIKKKKEEENDTRMMEPLAKAKEVEVEESSAKSEPSSHLRPHSRKMASGKEVENNTIPESSADRSSKREEHRTSYKRRAATQAKNNLLNPSKGKQKRVRDIRNLNKEDEMLMEVFGIIPSKVCLSRVRESENVENNPDVKIDDKIVWKNKEVDECKRSPRKRNKTMNEWSKAISMGNSEMEIKENVSLNELFSDDDSDIEVVEPQKTVIVVDDDVEESLKTKTSPKKSDIEIMKDFGIKDVAVKLDKAGIRDDKMSPGQVKGKNKSETELLGKHSIKDLSVSLSPKKYKKAKPGPKSKTQIAKIQARESKSTSSVTSAVKDFEELSPDEIQKMLYECGMGISVPASTKDIVGDVKNDRTPSPVPSTSKGHGHLKRKRTARKSTKDSALFKKYKLKDSKVMLKSLSRIDVSLLRNPNSPFGKSDWLNHKFDSDTESDFEFDIPTPPLLEDFIETTASTKSNGKGQIDQSSKFGTSGRGVRNSPVKQKDVKIMEKFGIVDSVVVIDIPKKKQTSFSSETNKKKALSDEELRKKFGIPSTVVVVNSPSKSNGKKAQPQVNVEEKTRDLISFAEFRSALDSARKNILSGLKMDKDMDSSMKDTQSNDTVTETHLYKRAARKTRQSDVIEEKCVQSPKKQKTEGKEKPSKSSKLKSANTGSEKLNDKRQTNNKTVTVRKTVHSSNSNGKIMRKILPSRLKTLSVKLHRLKLNEALKTYKTKAVSRAIEVRHKKNRNLKDTAEQMKVENKNSASAGLSRLRHRGTDNSLEHSLKRKVVISKEKQNNKKSEAKRDTQVVKTARYRRCIVEKEHDIKGTENSNIEKMAKGLPVVKVTVPCLSSDEIMRLSQNIHPAEDTCIHDSPQNLSVKKIAEEVISQIIDKICCPEELSTKYAQQLDDCVLDKDETDTVSSHIATVKKPSTEDGQKVSGDRHVANEAKDCDYHCLVTESELLSSDLVEKGEKAFEKERTNGNENKVTGCETLPLEDSESDLSLISVMSENKESENEASKGLTSDTLHEDCSIDGKDCYVSKESGRTCIADLDDIPLGSSQFYDESEKENSFDEVDGDIEGKKEGLLKSVIENTKDKEEKNKNKKSFESEAEKKADHEIQTDNVLNDLKDNSDRVEHNDDNNDDKNVNTIGESSNQNSLQKSKELHSPSDESELCDVIEETEKKCDEKNGLLENRIFAETRKALSGTDLTGTSTKNCEGNDVKGMQILSAIIDSESGSRIGDVYTVEEAAKNIRRETSGVENETLDCQKNDLSKSDNLESASSDIIETIMEH